jgi:hypothetical protein
MARLAEAPEKSRTQWDKSPRLIVPNAAARRPVRQRRIIFALAVLLAVLGTTTIWYF